MDKCQACGGSLQPGTLFCGTCGQQQKRDEEVTTHLSLSKTSPANAPVPAITGKRRLANRNALLLIVTVLALLGWGSFAYLKVATLTTGLPQATVTTSVPGTTPSPASGRVNFIAPIEQLTNVTIDSGNINTYTMSGLPAGIQGIVYKVFFTSPSAGAGINLAPHGGNMNDYGSLGTLYAANVPAIGNGIIPVDGQSRIDIQANGGNCTVALFTYGYIL